MRELYLSENPTIDLYHVASYESLEYIFSEGIYPISQLSKSRVTELFKDKLKDKSMEEIIENTPSFKIKKILYDNIPAHKNSVFLWKSDPFLMHDIGGLPITVHADKIPCRCLEGNSEILERLFKKYAQSQSSSYKVPREKLRKLEKDYKDSIRPLDDKDNDYRTEVMCPCHVPVEAIEVPPLFKDVMKK